MNLQTYNSLVDSRTNPVASLQSTRRFGKAPGLAGQATALATKTANSDESSCDRQLRLYRPGAGAAAEGCGVGSRRSRQGIERDIGLCLQHPGCGTAQRDRSEMRARC